jgi:peptidoglycan/LPS O-acetylase OafA/YrhL
VVWLLLVFYSDMHTWIIFITQAGWAGVDLFFVLSGYLVSRLLFMEYNHTQQIKLGKFLLRRGFKIYPVFYLMIVVTVLVNYFTSDPIAQSKLLSEIFFCSKLFQRTLEPYMVVGCGRALLLFAGFVCVSFQAQQFFYCKNFVCTSFPSGFFFVPFVGAMPGIIAMKQKFILPIHICALTAYC